MEKLLMKARKRKNLLKLLHYREIKAENSKYVKEHCQFTDKLIQRLGVDRSLEGHKGCVNCLQWSFDGSILASGSDDTNVILWDPYRYKNLKIISTNHTGNIFSVKFLGRDNSLIATAAGDYRVIISTINGNAYLDCVCHKNRVKRLATSPEDPHLFWSAGEDGIVIQYDIREPHECSHIKEPKVLIKMNSQNAYEIKCIAVNPTKPHYIAIGVNDCFVRLFDRRMLKTCSYSELNNIIQYPPMSDSMEKNVIQYYGPGHLAIDNTHSSNLQYTTTYISFNAAGSEMLMNLGGEQIYLFNVNQSRSICEMKMPKFSKINSMEIDNDNNSFINNNNNNNYYIVNSSNCKCLYEHESLHHPICLSNEKCINFLMKEAHKFSKRQWVGDLYNAARNYLTVIQNWSNEINAYVGLIHTLISMNWLDDAQLWYDYVCEINNEFTTKSQAKVLKQSILLAKHKSNKPLGTNNTSTNQDGTDLNTSEPSLDEYEIQKRLNCQDYESRFIGHCNVTTDIKEANFLGQDGNYIVAGSDEGIIFIWERKKSSIISTFIGDESIVNCVQPHPNTCLLATSGIDTVVKLWSPQPDNTTSNQWRVKDINSVIESNQYRMHMDPFETMLINMGYQIRGVGLDDAPSCQPC